MKGRVCKPARGFSLVELMIALAITAILMVALATALNASIVNYRQNEDIFRTVNTARQALLRITTDIRTGYLFLPSDPINRCSFYTAQDKDITYEYRSGDSKLYLVDNDSGQEYVLCDNVTEMSFIKTPTDDGMDVKSVQISITVSSGTDLLTVSAAVRIRRNL